MLYYSGVYKVLLYSTILLQYYYYYYSTTVMYYKGSKWLQNQIDNAYYP